MENGFSRRSQISFNSQYIELERPHMTSGYYQQKKDWNKYVRLTEWITFLVFFLSIFYWIIFIMFCIVQGMSPNGPISWYHEMFDAGRKVIYSDMLHKIWLYVLCSVDFF